LSDPNNAIADINDKIVLFFEYEYIIGKIKVEVEKSKR
jgi:hypothetical protein